MAKQSEWPRVKREPDAYVLVPDGFTRTDRSAVGPLRPGTVRNGVGPRGRAPQDPSDYGMDHLDREFDPIGTSKKRYSNPTFEDGLIGDSPAPRNDGRDSRRGPSARRATRGPKPGTSSGGGSNTDKA